MSAKPYLKHRHAPKRGFKPQIPDASDEEMIGDPIAEIPETEPNLNRDSGTVAKKKRRILALLRSWCVWPVSFFPFAFSFACRFARRIVASGYAKAKNIQQSYLESITAEAPQEENTTVFPQKNEPNQEKITPVENPVLAEQIEATTNQLAELYRHPASSINSESENQADGPEEEEFAEEEAFNEDDFDEAVRKARLKLVTAAALVFFCVGGYFAYQFVAARWSKENFVASEESNVENEPAWTEQEPFEIGPPAIQPIQTNPPVAWSSQDNDSQNSVRAPDEPDLTVSDFPLDFNEDTFAPAMISQFDESALEIPEWESPVDDFGSLNTGSLLGRADDDDDDEFMNTADFMDVGDFMDDEEGMIAKQAEPPVLPSVLSLSPSPPLETSTATAVDSMVSKDVDLPSQMDSRRTIQGETQSGTITIPRSPVAALPLPTGSSPVHLAAPSARVAEQFQEDRLEEQGLFHDDGPFTPTLAVPNQRYQADAASLGDDVVIPTPSGNERRQRTLPFGQSQPSSQSPESQTGTETRASANPSRTLSASTQDAATSRQYTVQDGDNLFNIARRELGHVSRWREIHRLNREALGENVGYLTPGTVIFMPE